jgi:hypothetical protein
MNYAISFSPSTAPSVGSLKESISFYHFAYILKKIWGILYNVKWQSFYFILYIFKFIFFTASINLIDYFYINIIQLSR